MYNVKFGHDFPFAYSTYDYHPQRGWAQNWAMFALYMALIVEMSHRGDFTVPWTRKNSFGLLCL